MMNNGRTTEEMGIRGGVSVGETLRLLEPFKRESDLEILMPHSVRWPLYYPGLPLLFLCCFIFQVLMSPM